MVIMSNEDKELIVYTGAKIPIGKKLYDMIDKVGRKMLMQGTDTLPFKAELDIRNGGKATCYICSNSMFRLFIRRI